MSHAPTLGVNIDHVATLRQARYPVAGPLAEPRLIVAATACEKAGARSITLHLRADRRHVQDADVFEIREGSPLRLNLEMGNTPEILQIALKLKPDDVCLVPENRREVTTEGGLDVIAHEAALRETIRELQGAGIRVSLFVDPELRQVEASIRLGAEMVELHTGAFANAMGDGRVTELERLIAAANCAAAAGIEVNAGHGINYENIFEILQIPHLAELNIGHSIVSRAVFVGLETAVQEMLAVMVAGSGPA